MYVMLNFSVLFLSNVIFMFNAGGLWKVLYNTLKTETKIICVHFSFSLVSLNHKNVF